MSRSIRTTAAVAVGTAALCVGLVAARMATLGGPLPGPLPLFPADNWWNLDISTAPIDPDSSGYIAFINNGSARRLHPDFGGDVSPGSVPIYGFPYVVVDSAVPKRAVEFEYADESDGVDHTTGVSYPFYPIPAEAITQPHWIEGGEPGNVDLRASADRHLLIVDRDSRHLYELYNVFHDGTGWLAGSGAFFDLDTNDRRPEGWTSADAAGLAILPGLVRYDEVFGPAEIRHAFRTTVRATNGYVYPASHQAGSRAGALPMGARLRLKASHDISGHPPEIQKIFRAMQTYGLIVADNGSDMYVSGVYDPRWDNDVLNPAFGSLTASDFDVVELGYRPPAPPSQFDVTVAKAGTGTGTVTSNPGGIDCGGTCQAGFSNGALVDLTALASAGSTFAGFSGDPDCADGMVSMTRNVSCTATFDLLPLPPTPPMVPGAGVVDYNPHPMDLNGDGLGDSIRYDATTGGATIDAENGLPGIETILTPAGGQGWSPGWTVKTGDFNGDGLTDLFFYDFVNGAWYKAISDGMFGFSFFGDTWSPGWSVAIVELNGDSRADVFLYNAASGQWFRCTSLGDGTSGFSYVGGGWSPGWQIHAVHLNADGLTDLFLYGVASGQWFRALNDGVSGFGFTSGAWSPAWEITPGDYDGDSLIDLFLYDATSGQWFVAMNTGSSWSFTSGSFAPGWTARSGDFDGDGRSDLFRYNATTGQWFESLADGAGQWTHLGGSWSPGWHVVITSFNLDALSDVLVYDPISGTYFQCVTTNPGAFSYVEGSWGAGQTIIATSP